ncbi:Vascular endothelial growth factor receptor 1 [Chionoecetes opilio]|uniref:Vascular endothelial growth factor receptor 1 n=1 Tax=Chionoecetes opilio TaxID=41210 RepID=A0A8J4XSM8_CHIOP|nr:Vascular endothelial growth factor receptor 1 [Chionoecetes opilio]
MSRGDGLCLQGIGCPKGLSLRLQIMFSLQISIEQNYHDGYFILRFASVSSSDFGNYTITITTADDAAQNSSTVLMEVKSAPHMTLKEIPLIVEGESQSATCVAQGFPKPSINMQFQTCSSRCSACEASSSIQAEKNETRHPDPGNVVERSITFSANTSGFLFCFGKNVNGSSSTSEAIRISDIGDIFVLRHTGQDDKITREEDDMDVTITENDEFSLMCAGNERGVQFDEDSNMNNQTVVVEREASFTLDCTVTGSPRPTITWRKDNKNLANESEFFDHNAMQFLRESQVLKFAFVLKKHEGEYTCQAENRISTSVSSLTLTVPGISTGLITAFVGIVSLVIVIVFLMNRMRQERKTLNAFIALENELHQMGKIELLNPSSTVDEQAELLPCHIAKWEVPRSNITIGEQLGAGAFGRVVKASVTGLEGPACTTVAIKMCKNAFDISQTRALALELKIMMNLGKHLNIVNLKGASTDQIRKGELWIMVEYCRFGNLINFMQRHRSKFTNLICPETGKIQHHLVANLPVSPCFSESNPPVPAIAQDSYLCSGTSKLVLSDPPPGRSTETDPSSTVLAPGNSRSRAVANNPLYTMGVGVITEEPENIGNFGDIQNLQSKGNRILSIGSDNLADDSSSRSLNSQSNMTTGDTQQTSCHSPLSPTESYFEKSFDYMDEIGSVPGVNAVFSSIDLISWAWQVAQGMEYLCRRKILHGDLAARNILLADNNRVKISDFGLSRNIQNDQYLKEGKDQLLPIKWMSVEAIRDCIFSTQSDVWAFGITLWEIFSLGNTPYPGMNCSDFVAKLLDGHRMACPEYANEEIYKIMTRCWEVCPLSRPSFTELGEHLGRMMKPDLKEEYVSENDAYMKMNLERFKEETDYLNMMADPSFQNFTSPEEVDVSPNYMNVAGQTRTSDSLNILSADTAAYSKVRTSSLTSTNVSSAGSNYLPMNNIKSQAPTGEVFSPRPSEPSSQSAWEFRIDFSPGRDSFPPGV